MSYSVFDKPEISKRLFYPRQEFSGEGQDGFQELLIPVENDVFLGGRFYRSAKEAATILFFHGNGEIVSDYHDLAAHYIERGINFLPVDYRGYGRSSSLPTFSTMMQDSHRVFHFILPWLVSQGCAGPVLVMGRSLGSAPALEVALHNADHAAGLIIESGFAYIVPLLDLLGIDDPDLSEAAGPENIVKIRQITMPTLIIHAEHDRIIPLAEGEALFAASGSRNKKFQKIPGADHNDIFMQGMKEYMDAVDNIVRSVVH